MSICYLNLSYSQIDFRLCLRNPTPPFLRVFTPGSVQPTPEVLHRGVGREYGGERVEAEILSPFVAFTTLTSDVYPTPLSFRSQRRRGHCHDARDPRRGYVERGRTGHKPVPCDWTFSGGRSPEPIELSCPVLGIPTSFPPLCP